MGSEAISLFPVKRNEMIGELKLQSCEEANIFYATHVMSEERLGEGDYSAKALWQPAEFTHGTQRHEETVDVDGDTTIIQGHFKDRAGEMNQQNWEYEVIVYLWVEVEEDEKGECK